MNDSDTAPEYISDVDLERHQRMLMHVYEAQTLSQQAQQLQARANELEAAFRIWAEELHERYHLDASRGESVQQDGAITRSPALPLPNDPPSNAKPDMAKRPTKRS